MKTLILTGSAGSGHHSVADAYSNALSSIGMDIRIEDSLKMLGRKEYIAGQLMYKFTLRYQGLFDAYHFSQMRAGGSLGRAADRASARKAGRALKPFIDWLGNGIILSVFATGSAAAGLLRVESNSIRTVASVTDATATALWVHQGTDLYLVGSELTANTVRAYDPNAKIVEIPPAVRPQFFTAPDRDKARNSLGIPTDSRCVLVIPSGLGIGPIEQSADVLVRDGWVVLAVAGHNKKLYRRLTKMAKAAGSDSSKARRGGGKLIPFGFTDRVPELMSACDIVVTASGQTCHEARVVGRPLLVLDIVPGHGRENMLHQLELGGARESIPDPSSIRQALISMYDAGMPAGNWPVDSFKEWTTLLAEIFDREGLALS